MVARLSSHRVALVVAVALVLAVVAGPAVALAQSPAPPADVHIPTVEELTPALLSAIVAAIISLLFRFVPALSTWLDQMSPTGKQTFMLVVTLIVAGAIGAWNFAHSGITEQSVLMLALTVYTALTSNQTTYSFVKWHPESNARP